ncbi:hypothetical protein GOP47_0014175 [Adiantum capillus-veneris]|uniref:Pentatricopeptide repeat-containing protein n=1 Tax=Adiantum capillus-veneris TaxID=13818 RepID=A0A9D4UQF6_ADICA|nr:hypothetical protein GOP47_0014175 [Adiantum capillus-veneris]
MREPNVAPLPPKSLCALVLKSADALACRNLHHYIVYHGYLPDAYVPNYLIRVYARCSCLPDARNIFNQLVNPSVFAWSAIISAYAQHALHEQAFELYAKVRKSKVQLDGHVYTAVLNACVCKMHLMHGKMVHGHILGSPYKQDVYVNNTLIDMYARCGCLHSAHQVFHGLPCKDIVSWNTLLAGYVHHKAWEDILILFKKLNSANHQPNSITFVCALKACARLRTLGLGMACHFLAVDYGLELVQHINNVLIDVYTKCGSLHDAEDLFGRSPTQDVVTWTSIISGYVNHGYEGKAFKAYEAMRTRSFKPNEFTYASILKACANVRAFDQGMLIHTDIAENFLIQNIIVNNALIGMYAQCGSFHDAVRAFEQSWERDVVAWNSIIVACTELGHAQFALQLFSQLQQEGLEPDVFTLASMVRACSLLVNIHQGRVLHLLTIEHNLAATTCLNNHLLHMYICCSSLKEARRVFDVMQTHDVVTWNVMIGGYANCEQGDEALRLFDQMQKAAVHANAVTLVCMLKACSITSSLDKGRLLHTFIMRNNFYLNAYVGSALINFYVKCGTFEDARNVFSRLQERTVVPWSAMIAACAQQSNYGEAFAYFEKMQQQGVKLDDVAYVSLLSACSHAGIVHEHGFPWQLMAGLPPVLKHYNCLADIFGRSGYLSQAKMVLREMPFDLDMSSWISLFSHFRTYAEPEVTLPELVALQPISVS